MRAGSIDNRGVGGSPQRSAVRSRPEVVPGRLRRSARNLVVGAALGAVSLAFIAAIVGAILVGRAPAWWHTLDGNDASLSVRGADVENKVASELSRVRPGAAAGTPAGSRDWHSDEWTVEVDEGEASAWLNTRLRKWLSNRGVALPDQVRQIDVAFAAGVVRVGAGIAAGDTVRVASASVRPLIAKDGGLWVHESRLYAGRLPLPASWIAGGRSPEWFSGELHEAPGFVSTLKAIAGEAPLSATPVITLGDGRVVRVVGIEVRPGRLVVTCRTEATP